jgi:hypothetical protein
LHYLLISERGAALAMGVPRSRSTAIEEADLTEEEGSLEIRNIGQKHGASLACGGAEAKNMKGVRNEV